MKTTSQIYSQFLVSSQNNYTCTYLCEHFDKLQEDSVYRFLKNSKFTPNMIWEKAKELIVLSKKGYVLFDDVVIDKDFSFKIDGVRHQYSGNAHGIIKGIGVVTCIYYNPEINKYWIIDFRIFDPDKDGNTKIDHMTDMLNLLDNKGVMYNTVLMDNWYATTSMMLLIDSKKKIYYCPIKANRNVDDSYGTEDYKRADFLYWTAGELKVGKLVKLKKFPGDKKMKLFRVTISTNRTELIVTNDLIQNSTDDSRKEVANRWKIEQFHREIKQVTGIEDCQCRNNRSQRNHICLNIRVWLFLNTVAQKTKQTIYQVKKGLLRDYMCQQMRNPNLVFA